MNRRIITIMIILAACTLFVFGWIWISDALSENQKKKDEQAEALVAEQAVIMAEERFAGSVMERAKYQILNTPLILKEKDTS